MKRLLVLALLLGGCASTPQPPPVAVEAAARGSIYTTGVSATTSWARMMRAPCLVAIYGTWDSADVTVQHSYDGGTTALSSTISGLVGATADVEETGRCPGADYRLLFNSGAGGSTDLTFIITPTGQ